MKTNLIKRSLKGIGLSAFMLFGVTAFSNVEANAQYRNNDDRQERREDRRDDRQERREDRREDRQERREDRHDNGYGNNNIYRRAQQQGRQDGLSAGQADGRDRDRHNPQKSSYYKRGTNGYESRNGNKNAYQNIYRQAFIQGYNEGYNSYRRQNNRRNGRGW